jgi:predicted negative regulator of RcsB-dependent stress response
MKHPQREEWVPFLFGEATPATQKRLAAHLEDCRECATEIAAWRRSLGRLDRWRLPSAEQTRANAAPAFRWAVAAAIVLGLGFGIGWLSKPSASNAAELRAQVEASVNAVLASELRQQMAAEIERVSSQAQGQSSNALAALELRLARTSETGLRQVLQGLTDVLNSAREEDRRAFATLLDQVQEQRTTDYVSLRKDLETLATLTDDEIRQARSRLSRLDARAPSDNGNE